MTRITGKQMRALWASAHRAGLTEERLRALAVSISGSRSIHQLSTDEASRLINAVRNTGGGGVALPLAPDRITPAQAQWIEVLGRRIHWDPPQILGLARRMYSVQRLEDLTRRQASGVIEALKALGKRSRPQTAA